MSKVSIDWKKKYKDAALEIDILEKNTGKLRKSICLLKGTRNCTAPKKYILGKFPTDLQLIGNSHLAISFLGKSKAKNKNEKGFIRILALKP